ncbi:hypothetical protein GCM10010411_55480 [Actinomadura fulvescens]|uniref:Uncharacterized protein n=1 Tax=Actinomadura fulvescens TaxID=46160 RepID=A0ABP6CC56_9ACTN
MKDGVTRHTPVFSEVLSWPYGTARPPFSEVLGQGASENTDFSEGTDLGEQSSRVLPGSFLNDRSRLSPNTKARVATGAGVSS